MAPCVNQRRRRLSRVKTRNRRRHLEDGTKSSLVFSRKMTNPMIRYNCSLLYWTFTNFKVSLTIRRSIKASLRGWAWERKKERKKEIEGYWSWYRKQSWRLIFHARNARQRCSKLCLHLKVSPTYILFSISFIMSPSSLDWLMLVHSLHHPNQELNRSLD